MADENEEKSSTGFTQIKPVAINLTTKSPPDRSSSSKKRPKLNIFIWTGFSLLLITAGVVIFLLPRWINTADIVPTQVSTPADTAPQRTSQPVRTTAGSPWERAQESKLRRDSQEILEQLLEAQKTLVNHGVMKWAEQEYTQAMQHAESGDKMYNQREFNQAHSEYEQALIIFNELVERLDGVFEETMEKGNQALADGDSKGAKEAFQLALAIDKLDRAANIGRERAQTLDEIIALINKGDDLLQDEQLEQAKATYQQALDLDSHSAKAKLQIQLADQKILDREFNHNMSSGFSALENNRLKQARQSFTAALKLKPRSIEAKDALKQTKQKITTIRINSILDQAKKLETEERWHDALTKYNSALELNASLAEAQAGQTRTTTRTKLHDRLKQILTHPERLYEQAVYDETVEFFKILRTASNPGPVLTKQLIALTNLLSIARTPITIRLQSDNMTQVTLYKVGELGYFLTKELSLRPGRYVAVGKRDGYQDVRVSIFVDPENPGQTFTIIVIKKIALGTQP